jgi:hypothetical protein
MKDIVMDNDNGIEFTVEYEKLLVEAQEKHKAYKREADSYKYCFDKDSLKVPDDVRKKLDAAEDAWYSWLKENITDKGFKLEFDLFGRPIGLLKVLVTRYADYI